MRIITGLLISVWFLLGCSEHSNAISSSEIGNPTIAGTLQDTAAQPIAHAQVALYKLNSEVPLGIVHSDENGQFEFNDIDSGSYQIEAMSSDSLLVGYYAHLTQDTLLGDMELLAPGRIHGVVTADFVSQVALAGTHYRAHFLENGEYEFPLVAPGSYSLILAYIDSTGADVVEFMQTVSVAPNDDIVLTGGGLDNSLMLLDNFEDRNYYHVLQPIFGSGYWYMLNDSNEGGQSTTIPTESYGEEFSNAIDAYDSVDAGLSLKVLVDLDESIGNPYAGIAVSLGVVAYDLRIMDSLVVKMRGDGTIEIELEREIYDESDTVQIMRGGWVFENTLEWQTKSLMVSDLVVNPEYHPDGLSTQDLLRYVFRIKIKAISGTWFALDTISLGGITLNEIDSQFQ